MNNQHMIHQQQQQQQQQQHQMASASEDENLQSGEDEGTAFLDGMTGGNSLSGKQPEKGILKKSGGIYGPVGSGGGGGSVHGSSLTLPLSGGVGRGERKDKWCSEESQSDCNQEVMSVLLSPEGTRSERMGGGLASSSLSDVERTLKSLNGYHEDILQALRSAAASSSQRSASTASLSDELRKTFVESYADYFPPPDYLSMRSLNNHDHKVGGGGGVGRVGGPGSSVSSTSERMPGGLASPLPGGMSHHHHGGGDMSGDDMDGDLVPPCGPIRIRNLEDLIRQLERHSARHTSPNGSEAESETERHYRLMEAAAAAAAAAAASSQSDPQSGGFVYGRYRQPTAVPGISLYEASSIGQETDKSGGDPGDSDESER